MISGPFEIYRISGKKTYYLHVHGMNLEFTEKKNAEKALEYFNKEILCQQNQKSSSKTLKA